MPYDSTTGIYTYDGTEAASPYKTMLNLLANSVRTAIGNLAASFSDTQQGAAQWAYNAFFDVWQNGTGDFTATGWTADRWNMISRVATTVRRVTFPATDTFFKTAYGYQIQATAATNSSKHVQAFPSEDVALMRGRTVVFEVPAQALTSATTQLTIAIEKSATANVTTTGTWNVVNSTTATVTQAGTKVLVTTTIPADTTAAGVRISISTNNLPNSGGVNISAVTFKPGSTGPTEPQRRGRTIKGEERECMAFLVVYTANPGSAARIMDGTAVGTLWSSPGFITPVPMRTNQPSPTFTGSWGLSDGATVLSFSGFGVWATVSNSIYPGFSATASGMTAFRTYRLEATSINSRFILSAELP